MNLELQLARRLYGTRKGKQRVSRPAVTIAKWGVAIGTAVMFVSICIIVGFKQQVRDKIIGFGGHIQILSYTADNGETHPITADSQLLQELQQTKGVEHIQQYVQAPGMILSNGEYEGIVLKGIDKNYNLSFISSHITSGEIPCFSADSASNSIIISEATAERLKSKVGDKVNIYFLQDGIKARRMKIAATYETHLTELDDVMAITDIYTTRKINGWGSDKVTGIEVLASNYEQRDECRNDIATATQSACRRNSENVWRATIDELYPAIFNWLGVLDQTVWIIMILVAGIACFTMVSGLFILILEKSSFIGIMKALGANNGSIRRTFIYYSSFIVLRGLLLGNAIALVLCLTQQHTGLIALDPEMYYMERVPIEFTWLLLPMNIAMFIISTAVLVIPSMLISKVEPTKAIKFE